MKQKIEVGQVWMLGGIHQAVVAIAEDGIHLGAEAPMKGRYLRGAYSLYRNADGALADASQPVKESTESEHIKRLEAEIKHHANLEDEVTRLDQENERLAGELNTAYENLNRIYLSMGRHNKVTFTAVGIYKDGKAIRGDVAERTCEWKANAIGITTSCREYDIAPKHISYKFCPYCSGLIVEK